MLEFRTREVDLLPKPMDGPTEESRRLVGEFLRGSGYVSVSEKAALERVNPADLRRCIPATGELARRGINSSSFMGVYDRFVVAAPLLLEHLGHMRNTNGFVFGEAASYLMKSDLIVRDLSLDDGLKSIVAAGEYCGDKTPWVVRHSFRHFIETGHCKACWGLKHDAQLLGYVRGGDNLFYDSVLNTGLRACIKSGIILEQETLRNYVEFANNVSDQQTRLLVEGLPAIGRTGVVGEWGHKKLYEGLIRQGLFDDDFWVDFAEVVKGVRVGKGEELNGVAYEPDLSRACERMPMTAYLLLKSVYRDDANIPGLDLGYIGGNSNFTRTLLLFLKSDYPDKRGLLDRVSAFGGRHAHGILRWTTIAEMHGIRAESGFEDAEGHLRDLRRQCLTMACEKMGVGSGENATLAAMLDNNSSNLPQILSSLTAFLPPYQVNLLATMTRKHLAGDFSDYRFGRDAEGNLPAGFEKLTEAQRSNWMHNRRYKISLRPNEFDDFLVELRDYVDSVGSLYSKAVASGEVKPKSLSSFEQIRRKITSIGHKTWDTTTHAKDFDRDLRGLWTAMNEVGLAEESPQTRAVIQDKINRFRGMLFGQAELVETDDFVDMLNTGVFPVFSCLQWVTPTSFNKALLDYPVSWFNKKVEIRREDNTVARRVFRLLPSSEGVSIIVEPSYPGNNTYDAEMMEFIVEKASSMGVRVLEKGCGVDVTVPESRNKYVVSDALFPDEVRQSPVTVRY